MLKNKSVDFLVKSALIAAIYVVFTVLPPFNAIGFSIIQFRISEALMILCVTMPQAVLGVSIGCLLSNVFASGNPFDIFFGTFATVAAAITTWKLRDVFLKNNFLAPLPTVLFNTVIVGLYLPFIIADVSLQQLFEALFSGQMMQYCEVVKGTTGVLASMAGVFVGEAVVCYVLGIPLMRGLKKLNLK